MLEEFAAGRRDPHLPRARRSRSSPTSPASCSAPSRPPTPPTGSRHVREPVRFADARRHPRRPRAPPPTSSSAPTRCSDRDGRECLPRPSEQAAVRSRPCARAAPRPSALTAALAARPRRRRQGRLGRLLRGHRRQARAAADLPLPAPALLARRRRAGAGDLGAAGLQRPPSTRCWAPRSTLADGEGGWLLTGRLSLADPPLAGRPRRRRHRRSCPAPPSSSWRCAPAEQVGAERVEELDPAGAAGPARERRACSCRSRVAAPDEDGRRDDRDPLPPRGREEAEWTAARQRHPRRRAPPRRREPLDAWPPDGRRAARRRATSTTASPSRPRLRPRLPGPDRRLAARRARSSPRSRCPTSRRRSAERFGIHPALLDAALHAIALVDGGRAGSCGCPSPGAASALARRRRRGAAGRGSLPSGERRRARRSPTPTGAPVAAVGDRWRCARSTRPSCRRRPRRATACSALELGRAGRPATEAEPRPPRSSSCCRSERRRGDAPRPPPTPLAPRPWSRLQDWHRRRGRARRLAFLTERRRRRRRRRVARPGRRRGLGPGPLRPVRAPRPLRPDRQRRQRGLRSRAARRARRASEPQLALREGSALAPAPGPRRGAARPSAPRRSTPSGTVLITGGTGGLGALVARHLVDAARRPPPAAASAAAAPRPPGAAELRAELEELGAEVDDRRLRRRRPRRARGSCSPRSPPSIRSAPSSTAAGVLDDGHARVARPPSGSSTVFAPKADAAWHLHELTAGARPLRLRPLLLGRRHPRQPRPGQLRRRQRLPRRARPAAPRRRPARHLDRLGAVGAGERHGRPGSSEADLARIAPRRRRAARRRRAGPRALRRRARAPAEPRLVAGALRPRRPARAGRAGTLPPISARPGPRARAAAPRPRGSLAAQLAAAARGRARGARARAGPRAGRRRPRPRLRRRRSSPSAAFKELGFDSLAAVELRNRLGAATGLRLPPTLVFDYPTAGGRSPSYLLAEASGERRREAGRGPRARRSEEPIAIVGMACRYPGGVGLARGALGAGRRGPRRDRRVPRRPRLGPRAPLRPRPRAARHQLRPRGRLPRTTPATSTPSFFGISPREALAMDPQQRLLLEAPGRRSRTPASTPPRCAAAQTGVFAGVMHHDYGAGAARPASRGLPARSPAASSPAASPTPSASRARRSPSTPPAPPRWSRCTWRRRRCAGASARWRWPAASPCWPRPASSSSSAASAASPPTGAASPSPTRADGTGLGEGVGMLVLERLSDAERNGHPVLAVIRGSAVNQDGASNGLTAPNGPSQERVIRQALANAGLSPARRRRGRGPRHRHHPRRPDRGRGPARHLRPGARRAARCGWARSSPTSATPRPPPASPA